MPPVWASGRFGFGCLILAFGRVGFGCLISAFGRLAGWTAPCSGMPRSLEMLPAGKRVGLRIGMFVSWEVRRLGRHLAPERLGHWKGCRPGQCIGLCIGRCGCLREVRMSMHVSCVSRRTSVCKEGFLLRIVFFFLSCNLLYPIRSINLLAVFSVYSVSSVSSVFSVFSCKWQRSSCVTRPCPSLVPSTFARPCPGMSIFARPVRYSSRRRCPFPFSQLLLLLPLPLPLLLPLSLAPPLPLPLLFPAPIPALVPVPVLEPIRVL